MSTEESKREAYRLFQKGEPDQALSIISKVLNEHPDDKTALFIAGEIFIKASRHGMAHPFYRRILELDPTMPEAWNNLGHCHHTAYKIDEAVDCFIKALNLGGDDFSSFNNLLLMNTVRGDHENALRLLRRALFHAANDEDRRSALANSALAHLALRHWPEGWAAFDLMLGQLKQRRRREFGVPDWDGKTPGLIAVYGEQGLGDEVMFASMIPDMIAAGHKPVIECDPRLAGLFARSFPCPVFGSRREEKPGWVGSMPLTAKAAIGSLARFYRNHEPFPSGPYLKACPIRRKHIRAGLDEIPGRKIGIAWSGGTHSTRQKDRSLSVSDLEPLLSIPGITWISLEYKGEAPSDERILHWPALTQTQEYDDTAALVAELDEVVTVTTTVALLSGALGRPCKVLVPEHPTWHWSAYGDMPWYDCLRLYRRKGVEWKPTIEAVGRDLRHGT